MTWKTRKRTKKTTAMKWYPVKYFTRQHLIECAKLGLKWDYNRQVSEKVAELPDGGYPVMVWMYHHHRHCRPCKEHVRCLIEDRHGHVICIVDVPTWYHDKLPVGRINVEPQFWGAEAA